MSVAKSTRITRLANEQGPITETNPLHITGGGAGGATETTLEAVEERLETLEDLFTNGTAKTTLSGSNGELDLQGPVASRPSADSVPENSTYFALDEGKLYWTNGSTWAEVGA